MSVMLWGTAGLLLGLGIVFGTAIWLDLRAARKDFRQHMDTRRKLEYAAKCDLEAEIERALRHQEARVTELQLILDAHLEDSHEA